MKRVLLIDGDILAYRAAAAAEPKFDWGDGVTTSDVDQAHSIIAITSQIIDLQDKLDADRIVVALGDTKNFRKDILSTYKGNRGEKPKLLGFMREFITKTWETFTRPTLEGDDILGILSTAPDLIKGERIICSIDKDFKQIPGLLYNPDKDTFPRRISREEADYNHAYQTLIGDTTDNYKGCPGIGPKKATQILGSIQAEEYWPAIVAAYEDKGLTEADALIQARVARILRDDDYDRKNKKPILWTPPKRVEETITIHNSDGEIK